MIGQGGESSIHCPLGIFAPHERNIHRLTEEINRAATPAVKAKMAGELRDEAQALLSCDGQAGNVNCQLCREFSRLRVETASLVVRVSGLAR